MDVDAVVEVAAGAAGPDAPPSSVPPSGGEPVLDAAGLRALLDAIVAVSADLDLPQVLERVVAAACRLAAARYGALGVIGPDRRLSEFVTWGMPAEQRARIGHLPRGHGLLGVLIDDPRPLRLHDLSLDPRHHGVPAHHPPMRSFLGVPVTAGDRVFGNLYLTEKAGGADFSDTDEVLVVALASAAGVAIQNAQLYAESEQRRRWVEASAEITASLLRPTRQSTALRLIAERAREVARAEGAAIAVEDDDGELVVQVAVGSADGLDGVHLRRTPRVQQLLAEGRPAVVDDLSASPALADALPGRLASMASAVSVPFIAPGGGDGLLIVVTGPGARALGGESLEPVRSFAAQAALALDRAQAQADRESLALLEDRDRIARDLHDLVIQRLFATGLGLQGAARLAHRAEVAERIAAATEDLDATIRDIRATIFHLHRRPGDGDLRGELSDLVAEATHGLGFVPTLVIEGPVDSLVPDALRPHLVAVLREALSNAARHADATRVDVRVSVTGGRLVARVRDDGRGIGDTTRRSGLRNLRDRAEGCAGTLEVVTSPGGGTELTWEAPL